MIRGRCVAPLDSEPDGPVCERDATTTRVVDGKYMPFDEKLKAQGLKPSLRVALSVALYDTKEVKVLEQGVVFFTDLVRVREKYGLEQWAFEIVRHGEAKDPQTTYSILAELELSAEQQKVYQALPQHDLEKLYASESEGGGTAPIGSYDQKTGGTVDPKVAQAIATQLKALPREAVDRFLQKRGVPAAQVEKARAFLEQLQTEQAALAASETEVAPVQEAAQGAEGRDLTAILERRTL